MWIWLFFLLYNSPCIGILVLLSYQSVITVEVFGSEVEKRSKKNGLHRSESSVYPTRVTRISTKSNQRAIQWEAKKWSFPERYQSILQKKIFFWSLIPDLCTAGVPWGAAPTLAIFSGSEAGTCPPRAHRVSIKRALPLFCSQRPLAAWRRKGGPHSAEDCLMLWKLTRVGEVGMDMARATRARIECLSCQRCHRFRTADRTSLFRKQ